MSGAASSLPRGAVLLTLLALVATTACTDPMAEEPSEGEAAESPLGSETPEPARDTMIEELGDLQRLLATARDHLQAAAGSESLEQARSEAEQARELLVGDPDDVAPLFPVERAERGASGEREDQLSSMLTVTREAGGTHGRAVRELLRDLVAGDLGAWQRDADGMVAMVEQTLAGVGSVDAAEEAIISLPGEATRALGWAELISDATDPATAQAFAQRGATHLDIAVTAIDELGLVADDGVSGEGGQDDAEDEGGAG